MQPSIPLSPIVYYFFAVSVSVFLMITSCKPIEPVSARQPQATSVTVTSPVTNTATLSITLSINTVAVDTTSTVTEQTSRQADNEQELIARGYNLYLKQYCGICHQLDTLETRGTFGPPHNQMATQAAIRLQDPTYHGNATTPAEYIYESLVDPAIYLVPEFRLSVHAMPSYAHLSEEELHALVAMLLEHP